jgi:competence protein ComEC
MDKFPSLHFNEARVYVLVFILFALLVLKRRGNIAIVMIFVIIVQLVFSEISWPGKNWQVVNCDVGQGDAMVVNLGQNSAIVIDTGPDSKLIDDCLTELKITKIPLLILTHFHADHVGGITGVLKNRSIRQVWISNLHQPETSYSESIKALQNISVRTVNMGETYTFTKDDTEIKILWPTSVTENFTQLPGDGSKINNSSIAILLRTKNYSLFSAGDIEPEVQELISKSGLLSDVDILKVSHHGSAYQYLPMIDLLKPEIALISVGAKNSYGHPDLEFIRELEKRSISVWRTDLSGGISVAPRNKIRATGKEWWKIRWG